MLATYNSVATIDHMAELRERGNLTWLEVGKGVGQVGLNFLPYVGELKPVAQLGKVALYSLDGVMIGGQTLIMTSDAVQRLKELRDKDVQAVAALDAKIRERERTNPSDPELPGMRAQLDAAIKQAQDEATVAMQDMAKNLSFMLVQTAGLKALQSHMVTKDLGALEREGIYHEQHGVEPHYDPTTGTIKGDASKADPATIASLKGEYVRDMAAKQAELQKELGTANVEITRGGDKVTITKHGDGYTVEVPVDRRFSDAIAAARKARAAAEHEGTTDGSGGTEGGSRTADPSTRGPGHEDPAATKPAHDSAKDRRGNATYGSSKDSANGPRPETEDPQRINGPSRTNSAADNSPQTPNDPRYSYDELTIGEAPKEWNALKKWLSDESRWSPARQQLHRTLLDAARAEATKFATAMAGKGEPTVYAMRGNTASGKTRLAKSGAMPEIEAAVRATGDSRSINPDNFKGELMRHGGFTANEVHVEASVLADKLEAEMKNVRTADGKPASMMIDKRLLGLDEIERYAKMAEDSGRKFVMYDVDTPLENSLVGVLGRDVNGDDGPLVPYKPVADGFVDARGNRREVMIGSRTILKLRTRSTGRRPTAPSRGSVSQEW